MTALISTSAHLVSRGTSQRATRLVGGCETRRHFSFFPSQNSSMLPFVDDAGRGGKRPLGEMEACDRRPISFGCAVVADFGCSSWCQLSV